MSPKVQPSKALIYISSAFAIILWGMSYIWTDKLLELGIPVFYFVFVRILIAGVVLFLLNAAYGRIKRIQRQDLKKFMLLALFEPFIYFVCETYGVELTSPTISAMIIATIPIFSIAAGRIFFKERITGINIAGVVLSLVGIIMVIMKGDIAGKDLVWGIILLLIAVIAEVGHASITKSLSGNYSSQIIVMYQFLIGSVYLLPLFLWKGLNGFNEEVYFSGDVWYPIICLAFLCSSLAFSLWVSTIKNLGVAKSSIFSALIPVVTALIAWTLGTKMTPLQWGGIALSTFGVILSQYSPKQS
jgi:drug/metabolite transporter (DMT)-like permease